MNCGFFLQLSKQKFKSKSQANFGNRIKKPNCRGKKSLKENQGQKIRHVQVHICTERRQGKADGKHGDDWNLLEQTFKELFFKTTIQNCNTLKISSCAPVKFPFLELEQILKWPNPLPRRKRDWIFHNLEEKPQVVKNKIPYESRVALPQVTNGEFYPIPFSPWWRTDIPILRTKFWISILHMWRIDIVWFNFSTVETISIPHARVIDRAWF